MVGALFLGLGLGVQELGITNGMGICMTPSWKDMRTGSINVSKDGWTAYLL
jgi:hypothetical protein